MTYNANTIAALIVAEALIESPESRAAVAMDNYRSNNGAYESRDRIAEFAIQSEIAFSHLNDKEWVEEMMDCIGCHDYEWMPFVMNECAKGGTEWWTCGENKIRQVTMTAMDNHLLAERVDKVCEKMLGITPMEGGISGSEFIERFFNEETRDLEDAVRLWAEKYDMEITGE